MHHLPTQLKQLLIAYEKRIIALEETVEQLKEKYHDAVNTRENKQRSTRQKSQTRRKQVESE